MKIGAATTRQWDGADARQQSLETTGRSERVSRETVGEVGPSYYSLDDLS